MKNPINKIWIYGERCSGTNYLHTLLLENLENTEIEWSGKHFFHKENADTEARSARFIIIHRDPFDWLRSFHHYPWHAAQPLKGISFSDFIRKEWWCVWDADTGLRPDDPKYGTEMLEERCLKTGRRFSNVIQLRAAKIRNWESLRKRNSIYIRYEDLKLSPEAFIDNVSRKFDLSRKSVFRNIEEYKGQKGTKWQPKVYDAIAEDDLCYILGELDLKLEEKIGYETKALLSLIPADARRRAPLATARQKSANNHLPTVK